MLAYVSNFTDRNVIAIIQEPLKREFALADWQLGFLGGTAFALLYSVLGIPIARLAERSHRVNIIAISMGIWSIMTAFCGFANSYLMLVLGRIGVGVGEAGGTPPVHSLISSSFPQPRRAWALSVYSAGMPIGAMLAAIVGGWIAQEFGWRYVFWALGVPGIILAVLIKMTVVEPERPPLARGELIPPFRAVLATLVSKGTYRHVLAGSIVAAFVNAGIVQFTTSFFIRTHELSLTQATLIFGISQGVFATIGTLAGGAIVTRLTGRIRRVESWVCAIGAAMAGIMFGLAYFTSVLWIAIGVLMMAKFSQWLYVGPSFSMMQAVAPERGRATAMAIYLFCTSLLGGGLGPFVIGGLSDLLARAHMAANGLSPQACSLALETLPEACAMARADGLQTAILTFCGLFIWASFHFMRAGSFLERESAE